MNKWIATLLLCFIPTIAFGFKVVSIQHQDLMTYERISNAYFHNLPNKYSHYLFNAEGDINRLERYIERIKKDKSVDLILALGTISGKIAISKIKNKPIIISGIAAPGYSGLVKDWKRSGSNYVVIECKDTTYKTLSIFHNAFPFKKLGLIYLSKAPSHIGTHMEALSFCVDKSVNLISSGFENRDRNKKLLEKEAIESNIKKALSEVVPYVDVLYLNTSNTLLRNIDLIVKMANKYNVLTIGSEIYEDLGLSVSITSNYSLRGIAAAKYTVQVLERNADISTFPMDIIKDFIIRYNYYSKKANCPSLTKNFLNRGFEIKIR